MPSFEDLYNKLGLDYVIEPQGSLERFADESMDCVFSFHVLEHVPASNVAGLARHMFRITKPGRYTIHQIGIDDHLAHYDATVSAKQYIVYSDQSWKARFENEVQYFNRLQTSDWLKAYIDAGFQLVESIDEKTDISQLSVDPTFRKYSADELACTTLTLVLQKPA